MRHNGAIADPLVLPRLRTRRGLMFTALPALAVLAAVGAVLAIDYRDATVQNRLRETRQLAGAAAVNARGYLQDRFAVLAAVAAAPSVRRDAGDLRAYVVAAARGGRFDSLTLVDRRGLSGASSARPPGAPGVDLSDRGYVRAGLAGRPSVSNAISSRISGRPIVAFGFPVTAPDGQRGGVVAGSLRLDEVGANIDRLLFVEGSDTTVVDGSGNRIVGPERVRGLTPAPAAWPLAAMRRDGRGVREDVEGRVLAFAAVDGTDWLVVVDRERSELVGGLDRALYLEIAALALLAALGVALTFAVARRLDRLDTRRDEALAQQRAIAIQLQESMLPRLRVPEGLVAGAGYVPAQGEMSVGGDWYDLFDTGAGRVAMSVGDVAGHGLAAAATMGKLRSATRSAALRSATPTEALSELDRFAETLDEQPLATVVYAVLDLQTGVLRYASAGHPPPLLMRADGATELLEGGRSTLLGIGPGAPGRVHADVTLAPGDTLVMFTDGLVERPDSTIDAGLAALAELAGRIGRDPARLAAELLASVHEPRRDDAAVLAVQLVAVRHPSSVAS